MVYADILKGKYVSLRSIDIEDAEFALALRQDPVITRYLPRLNITLDQQIDWIKKQRVTEGDYFFLVSNQDNNPIGVIGLYDIQDGCGETGRIAVKGNAFQSIEAQLLCFDFAFNQLHLERTINYVYQENTSAMRFSQLFGSEIVSTNIDNTGMTRIDGVITKESFTKSRSRITSMLYR